MSACDSSTAQPVLPVCLLLRGKSCLVVGSGRAAARKATLLSEADADVTVVSPQLEGELAERVEASSVRHVARAFEETDLDGRFLVIAASEDQAENRKIAERCRERGVLCGAVDGSWCAGDLVLPAVFRQSGMTVAISSGGRSCRRTRMLKETLSRHMELSQTAELLVLGTSHHELPLGEREPFHLVGQRLERVGRLLQHVWGIHEFMVLNTCNRVEVHAVVSGDEETVALAARVLGFDRLQPEQYFAKRGKEAFEHLSVLSAGLLSQTPGENHIVAQVKESLERAVRSGWARGMMQEWVASALHVAKEIRNASAPLLRPAEIEDVCLDYVRACCPELEDGTILVLGSGRIGLGVAKRLAERGRRVDLFYHLHRPELAGAWAGRVRLFTFDDLREGLSRADLVICATDSPHHVVTAEHAACFGHGRRVLVCDLTMPRNVDPALGGAGGALKVASLEDLKHWYRREVADMGRLFALGSHAVDQHRELYARIVWKLGEGAVTSAVADAEVMPKHEEAAYAHTAR